ncbi:hypothetical protein SAMN05216357_11439 [Porphyromonadaceae bacterium KH3CP3RA]|nr:hypothetical protein SAMN05216357_11439 [Porphyromonadaceae bacterium KH3CP3RA]
MNNMKIYKLLVLLLAVLMTACSDYVDVEDPSPAPAAGNLGVYFPTPAISSFELEPTDPTEITLTVARTTSSGAADVAIIVETNDDDVFNVPQTASFANGETEATIKVTFPTAAEGTTYTLKLAVAGDENVNPYGVYLPYVTVDVTRIKWEAVEEPMVYVDGTFVDIWGTTPRPVYVHAEKAQLGESVRYRFKNVYSPATADPDEDGIYNGFYNNNPGFDASKDWYTIIEIHNATGTSGQVSMLAHQIGVTWSSYGMISIGSNDNAFGNLSNNVITFPANALFFSDNDGNINAATPTYIYLTKEAFIAANMKIDDFNDVEYEVVEGAVGVFESAAYGDTWDKALSKAIDIDEENEESEYKGLYYLSDLYAEGYGVAFYYANDRVRIPENQPIGTKVFGQDLFVSQSSDISSSVEVTDKGVTIYTLGLIFHFEDGTIVGDFAEKFYYSEEAVEYTKADFIGNFLMTGQSQFTGGAPAEMEVEIAEGADNNSIVITGIDYAEEVIASFDPSTSTISIKPQVLADIVSGDETLDATLYTRTAAGAIGQTAAIDFSFHLGGDLVITSTSEANGYLIRSEAAGGWLDGYRNIVFSPTEASAVDADAQSVASLSLRSATNLIQSNDNGNESNFRIQGKKSAEKFVRKVVR